jgi:hypothetical protein
VGSGSCELAFSRLQNSVFVQPDTRRWHTHGTPRDYQGSQLSFHRRERPLIFAIMVIVALADNLSEVAISNSFMHGLANIVGLKHDPVRVGIDICRFGTTAMGNPTSRL